MLFDKKCAIIISALPVVTFWKGDLKMSENTNSPAESGCERELTELEKTIVSDFKQLNEENQLAVIEFIISLLK